MIITMRFVKELLLVDVFKGGLFECIERVMYLQGGIGYNVCWVCWVD